MLLINPEHYKAVRGKKTDLKDGERIAELLQDGRLAGSYVPPVAIRVLRDLTRYRTKLVQYQSSIANRIQRLLEQCNVKLASVASDVLGVGALAMLRALAAGETNPQRMADLAKKQLRKKIPAPDPHDPRLPGTLLKPGIAYAQIYDWLVGARLTSACTAQGTVWTCGLSRPGGYHAEAIWDTAESCNQGSCDTVEYTVGANYRQYRTLDGDTVPIMDSKVPIGIKPILVENTK